MCIGNDDKTSIQSFYFCGAHIDRGNRPRIAGDGDEVADVKGLLHEQDHAGDEVLHDLLECKTDRETEDAETRQKSGDIEEALQSGDDPEDQDAPIEQLTEQNTDLVIYAARCKYSIKQATQKTCQNNATDKERQCDGNIGHDGVEIFQK